MDPLNDNRHPARNRWLAAYAGFTALSTLILICFGGLVTSHGAGMSVPDWPNSYGYNMFFFPVSQWVGGIFYEHTHRLVAAGVGLLTTVLMVWVWRKEDRAWLRWLGVLAFALVVAQGVLGGLRVTLLKDELGIFHATLAQLFFVLVGAIALFVSDWWQRMDPAHPTPALRRLFLAGACLILAQLALGATMRHQHAGLAVPDFPLAYGRLWPDLSPAAVAAYNQQRTEVDAANPITAFQILLHLTHRAGALGIFAVVLGCAWRAWRHGDGGPLLTRVAIGWLGVIVLQIALGAATVWTGKSADVATAHVAVGALSLAVGTLGTVICFRRNPRRAGSAEGPGTRKAEAAEVAFAA